MVLGLGEGDIRARGQQRRPRHRRGQAAQAHFAAAVPEAHDEIEIVAPLGLPPVGDELADLARVHAVDGLAMLHQPTPDGLSPVHEFPGQFTRRGGTDVEQQVAALARGLHQHVQQQLGRTPLFAGGVAPQPPCGHLARFPQPVGVSHDLVLGRAEVAQLPGAPRAGHRAAAGDVVAVVVRAQPVVDEDSRLQLPHHRHQVCAVPIGRALGPGAVEPDHVDLAVVGQQFAHLVMDVRAEGRPAFGVVTRTVPVRGNTPVCQRVVEADAQPRGAERAHALAHEVASRGLFGAGIVGEGRVPQAEAVVVARGEHCVFHAAAHGHVRPCLRVKTRRVPCTGPGRVLLLIQVLAEEHLLAAAVLGIRTPVNKHAVACVRKPLPCRRKLHRSLLFAER